MALKSSSSPPLNLSATLSQPPSPPPVLATQFPIIFHRYTCLGPELQPIYDQVFATLPQTPHFNPLAKCSTNTKEGIKHVYDMTFLNVVMKLSNSVDPFTFLSEVESYASEFEELEEMGYDLTKIKERFNLLKRRAEREKSLKDAVEKLEEEKRQREAKIKTQGIQLKRLAAEINMQKSEIESIGCKKRKIMDDSNKNLNEFTNLANNPW